MIQEKSKIKNKKDESLARVCIHCFYETTNNRTLSCPTCENHQIKGFIFCTHCANIFPKTTSYYKCPGCDNILDDINMFPKFEFLGSKEYVSFVKRKFHEKNHGKGSDGKNLIVCKNCGNNYHATLNLTFCGNCGTYLKEKTRQKWNLMTWIKNIFKSRNQKEWDCHMRLFYP